MSADPADVRATGRLRREMLALFERSSLGELPEGPHGIVQLDPATGAIQVFGPYESAAEVARDVEVLRSAHAAYVGSPELSYGTSPKAYAVVPHFSPSQVREPPPRAAEGEQR